jgi:2-aminoadipate transaminase
VPGRAAFLDGRGGSSMRLNFSGVDEDAIREGVRRIGEVVREQVELYGTLTGGGAPGRVEAAARPVDETLADVLPLPSRGVRERRSDAR